MSARTCNELGVCQGRKPACQGCSAAPRQQPHPFAPGVIEGYDRYLMRGLRFWLVRWVAFTAGAALVMFVAGRLL